MSIDLIFDDADLNGLVDGRIEPARAAALSESLASDPAARARADGWRRQNDSLRAMFASVLSEPVPVRLMPVAVVSRAGAAVPPVKAAARRRPRPALAAALGMAAVGFALGVSASVGTDGFGFGLPWSRRPGLDGSVVRPPAEMRDFAARAAEIHRAYLTDPVHAAEVPADEEAKLLRWIRQRVGGSLRIPVLVRQGWSLLGGRIAPGLRGPTAVLVYASGADRLGLMVTRGAAMGDGRPSAADGDPRPLGVAAWGDGAFQFAITSDRGPDWLTRNVGPLRDSVRAQARSGGEDAAQP